MSSPPFMVELCCGTGSISGAFLSRGCRAVGVDIKRRKEYKGEFICADVRMVAGHHFSGAVLIWASPPCNEFSLGNPMRRRIGFQPDMSVVQACVRIAADARAPLVLENVFGLAKYFGPWVNHWGKFYLWGDGVPTLLPQGPRWKDRQKMLHRSPALRARIPEELAAAIAHHFCPKP